MGLPFFQMTGLIAIVGPTACGKTALAAALASRIGGEVISGDSRQVYRGMDIGTGKDLADYVVGGVRVPYHLIDIAEPGEKYNVYRFQTDFFAAYDDVLSRGRVPILCGGSGLYVESVLRGYNMPEVPENKALRRSLEGRSLDELRVMLEELKARNGSAMHNTTDVDTAKRAVRAIEIELYVAEKAGEGEAYSSEVAGDGEVIVADDVNSRQGEAVVHASVFGISVDRDTRRSRISSRLRTRLDGGMVDEVRLLLDKGVSADDLMYYGLEYRYVTEYVIGRIPYEEMFRRLEIAIHQFAKRQMTWFRGMERRGVPIRWIDGSLPLDEKVNIIISEAGIIRS